MTTTAEKLILPISATVNPKFTEGSEIVYEKYNEELTIKARELEDSLLFLVRFEFENFDIWGWTFLQVKETHYIEELIIPGCQDLEGEKYKAAMTILYKKSGREKYYKDLSRFVDCLMLKMFPESWLEKLERKLTLAFFRLQTRKG